MIAKAHSFEKCALSLAYEARNLDNSRHEAPPLAQLGTGGCAVFLAKAKKTAYGLSTALLRWQFRTLWGMTIGEGVRISRSAYIDQTNPRGVKIGDWTAIGPRAAILTHDFNNGRHVDTVIGRNCMVGMGAIIQPGVTIGDQCIISSGSVVYADVPPNSIVAGNPARVIKSGIVTGKWGIQNPAFLAQEGVAVPSRTVQAPSAGGGNADALVSYLPQVSDPNVPFEDLAIDSFALITLRAEIEENEGTQISDEEWTEIERPADLIKFISKPKAQRAGDVVGATARRSHVINMPQMALGGLSESWLFKEVGDLHWSMLTSALGVKSRDIADQNGARLYATFTRLRYRSTACLAAFQENDTLECSAAMTRFGAGMFFSSQQYRSGDVGLEFEVMSSFSKKGESGSNTSLVKGQPAIPDNFAVPSLPEKPGFSAEYQALRAEVPTESIGEAVYDILPQHDINGVGLLYFAAYPTIADICLTRLLGAGSALEWSPVERDICYFANAGASERLIYRLHSDESEGGFRRCVGSLYRASDNTRMARIAVTLQNRNALEAAA